MISVCWPSGGGEKLACTQMSHRTALYIIYIYIRTLSVTMIYNTITIIVIIRYNSVIFFCTHSQHSAQVYIHTRINKSFMIYRKYMGGVFANCGQTYHTYDLRTKSKEVTYIRTADKFVIIIFDISIADVVKFVIDIDDWHYSLLFYNFVSLIYANFCRKIYDFIIFQMFKNNDWSFARHTYFEPHLLILNGLVTGLSPINLAKSNIHVSNSYVAFYSLCPQLTWLDFHNQYNDNETCVRNCYVIKMA